MPQSDVECLKILQNASFCCFLTPKNALVLFLVAQDCSQKQLRRNDSVEISEKYSNLANYFSELVNGYIGTSVTRLGDLLEFGQVFKPFGNN